MAYQTRDRERLLDVNMQAAIEKRGRELLGLALIVLATVAVAMIISYHPNDPSWMLATDAPVHNWMGRIGASIAAPLFMIVGWGSWGIAIVLGVWGVRLATDRGADRAVGRLIFAPIWVAMASVYAASLVPGAEWSHSYGLGGLFGDTVLGAVLNVAPVSAAFGLKALSLMMGLAMVVLGAFVLGATTPELKRLARFLLVGVIMTYAVIMNLLGRGASGALLAAKTVREKTATRREARAVLAAEQAEIAAAEAAIAPRPSAYGMVEDSVEFPQGDVAMAPEKRGLMARIPNLIRRPEAAIAEPDFDPSIMARDLPESELIEPNLAAFDAGLDMPGDDRIKAKIADAVRSRSRHGVGEAAPIVPLTVDEIHQRRPEPLVLDIAPTAEFTADFPKEPPMTASQIAPVVGNLRAPEPLVAPVAAPQSMPAAPIAIPTAPPRKVVQHATRKTMQPSIRAKAEAQPKLQFEDKTSDFELPPLSLLANPVVNERFHLSDEALEENARMLENVLDDYGVKGEIVSVRPGPVVTMYELEPAPGLKASRVIGLADDIARSMAALSARVSTVPGRSVIGIELPNENREKVSLREILSSRDFGDSHQELPLALGKDIGGDPMVANLAKMPHLLIAGTTGSGKSVAINTMILSLLYKLTPSECRMIMIDPKMLELSVYDGIPHLLSPVVTDPKKAVVALKWVVGEMEDRYRKMSKMGVRNIAGYNSRVADALAKDEMFSRTVQTGFDDDTGEPVFETDEFEPEKMPYIVVVVDEMADLMMVAGKEIEACIQRLAQMARASGIHLIMATQRPSVDVITGTIKANFPTRISFQVTSKIDSRTILGEMGAEQLLGMGDMLYMAGGAKITRCHGPFVSDEEVEEIVNHLKGFGAPDYIVGVVEGIEGERGSDIDTVLGLGGNTDGENALYDTAVAIVAKDRKCSTSYIQRKLAIGYNKAARLVEQMEDEGLVSPANHVGKREILLPEHPDQNRM